MSASDATTTIYVSDTAKEIETKVNKYAFSGGKQEMAEQKEKGADLDVDVAYQVGHETLMQQQHKLILSCHSLTHSLTHFWHIGFLGLAPRHGICSASQLDALKPFWVFNFCVLGPHGICNASQLEPPPTVYAAELSGRFLETCLDQEIPRSGCSFSATTTPRFRSLQTSTGPGQ